MTKDELVDIIETLIELQNKAHENKAYVLEVEYEFELLRVMNIFE